MEYITVKFTEKEIKLICAAIANEIIKFQQKDYEKEDLQSILKNDEYKKILNILNYKLREKGEEKYD